MTNLDATPPLAERLGALEAQQVEAARLIADLQARDALKTEFLANISHDLRTPLTAMITHAEILRDGILGDLSERQRESVQAIINGGRQLLDSIGEILTYARGAAGQLTVSRTEFSVGEVVAKVSTLNESLVARKGLALEVDVRRASLVAELVASDGRYENVGIELDLTGRERFVLATRRGDG